jgi:hypothetical protein
MVAVLGMGGVVGLPGVRNRLVPEPMSAAMPDELRGRLCAGRQFGIVDALDVQRGHPRISSQAYWSLTEENGSENCWIGAVLMVGLAGHQDDYVRLQSIAVLAGRQEVAGDEYFRAERSVWAIGLLAASVDDRDVQRRIVADLIDGTTPETWRTRGANWVLGGMTLRDTHETLAMMSIQALAFTGSVEAVRHLESLAASSTDDRSRDLVAQESLRMAGLVRDLGLAGALPVAMHGFAKYGLIE